MLVLKLKAGDKVQIGDSVLLEARRAKDSTLQLAIAAPRSLAINYDREGRASAPMPVDDPKKRTP